MKGFVFVSRKNIGWMSLFRSDFCFQNAAFIESIDKNHKERSENKENDQSSLIL